MISYQVIYEHENIRKDVWTFHGQFYGFNKTPISADATQRKPSAVLLMKNKLFWRAEKSILILIREDGACMYNTYT